MLLNEVSSFKGLLLTFQTFQSYLSNFQFAKTRVFDFKKVEGLIRSDSWTLVILRQMSWKYLQERCHLLSTSSQLQSPFSIASGWKDKHRHKQNVTSHHYFSLHWLFIISIGILTHQLVNANAHSLTHSVTSITSGASGDAKNKPSMVWFSCSFLCASVVGPSSFLYFSWGSPTHLLLEVYSDPDPDIDEFKTVIAGEFFLFLLITYSQLLILIHHNIINATQGNSGQLVQYSYYRIQLTQQTSKQCK